MARHRVFILWFLGLLCCINLILGEEYAPDPSLEDIKKMDAQEGLPRDYIPQKDENFYEDSNTQGVDRNEENSDFTNIKKTRNKSQSESKILQSIYEPTDKESDKEFDKRDTEETEVEITDEGQEIKLQATEGEEVEILEPEMGLDIEIIEPAEEEEIYKVNEVNESNTDSTGEQGAILTVENETEIRSEETEDNEIYTEDTEEKNQLDSGAQHIEDEATSERDEFENEELENNENEGFNGEVINEESTEAEENKNQFTGEDSDVNMPEYLTEYKYLQRKESEPSVAAIPPENADPICYLPPKTGFCKAAFRRFYFNAQTKECETFIYGGCGGNDNNFKTLEDCMAACSQTKV